MTPRQKDLVRESWERVGAIGDAAAELFYARLFEIDPTTRLLFAKADMTAQRGKLLQALGVIVANLERPETLMPFLAELGRRHAAYGVRRRHFATLGASLLWAFERSLGGDWTSETESAWAEAYAMVSHIMSDAMETGAG